jgi:hypothetical protein
MQGTKIERIKWIQRKFNFDYPPGMFPYFLERLRGTPARIEEIVHTLSEENLSKKTGNRWSIKEHIGHLADLEEIHKKRLEQLLANINILMPADMSNKKTYLANHNDAGIDLLLKNLRQTREHFTSRLEKLDETDIARSAIHPRLGKEMRVVDMVYFIAEHDDHHITIIREITSQIN